MVGPSSTLVRIGLWLWSWLRYVPSSRPSPLEGRWSGIDYEGQCLRSLSTGLLTWTPEIDPVNRFHKAIMLCIQKPFKLDDQFLKLVRVAWQAIVLLVCCKANVSKPSNFTPRSVYMTILVRRYSRSPIAGLKCCRSRRESSHTDPPTRSRILREVPPRPCPGLQTVSEHL